jgi:hypothetical protein
MSFSALVSFINLFLKENGIDYKWETHDQISFEYRGFNITFGEQFKIYYIITIPKLFKVEDDKEAKV